MSRLNIFLFLLALGLWSSIYVLKFKEDIREWYLNKFDKTPPKLPPDGEMPVVSLPFRYELPQTEDAAPAQDTDKTNAPEAKETEAPPPPTVKA
ncbi:hypothetical protein [Asaia krungthepensis]|uniref:Energy transducer TonB n=1 Tax=Asaia krungthepensis NRIC 0535 TaxID=1307925 RepID=A0ABQ0Q5P4_9PROT|nr:hypothetical protein [Asaia krungthepensis]GBQ92643.1 hypothetical protein AA0535_2611 [Asaia krungthepensis NRIC 0535]